MELKKYKSCPSCGEHNPPSLLECRNCEVDLTSVRVIDSTWKEIITEKEVKETIQEEIAFARYCECGADNQPQARKCEVCGEDISDILPTRTQREMDRDYYYSLAALDDLYKVTFDGFVTIIGREAAMKEYLSSKLYVSRRHAKLTRISDRVFIENLSRTNMTFINDVPITGDAQIELNDGDVIGFGGNKIGDQRQSNAAYFVFTQIK